MVKIVFRKCDIHSYFPHGSGPLCKYWATKGKRFGHGNDWFNRCPNNIMLINFPSARFIVTWATPTFLLFLFSVAITYCIIHERNVKALKITPKVIYLKIKKKHTGNFARGKVIDFCLPIYPPTIEYHHY